MDPSARAAGVRQLVKSLSPPSADEDGEQLRNLNTLVGMILDPSQNVGVLEAVYKTDSEALAAALVFWHKKHADAPTRGGEASPFTRAVEGLSKNVQAEAAGAKVAVGTAALQLHLEFFLSSSVLSALPLSGEDGITPFALLEKLVLPSLLFTKAKAKRAHAAWDTVLKSGVVEKVDLFRGCEEIVVEGKGSDESKDLAVLNEKLSGKLAGEFALIYVSGGMVVEQYLCGHHQGISSRQTTSLRIPLFLFISSRETQTPNQTRD